MSRAKTIPLAMGFAAVLVLLARTSGGDNWTGPNGEQLCPTGPGTCPTSQALTPIVVSDASGGAYFVWYGGTPYRVYVQRVTGGGLPPSPWLPTPLVASHDAPSFPQANQQSAVATGACNGGLYVAWLDDRLAVTTGNQGVDVVAQHVSSTRSLGSADLRLTGDSRSKQSLSITTSFVGASSDGALLVWDVDQPGTDPLQPDQTFGRIYADKIAPTPGPCDSDIDSAWTARPVTPAAPVGTRQITPAVTSDLNGGAIVVWQDASGTPKIHAQHIDPEGNPTGPPDLGAVVSQPGSLSPRIAGDGQGGALVAWLSQPTLGERDVYACHITGALAASTAGLIQSGSNANLDIAPDRAGGAILVWQHDNGSSYDVMCQRLNPNGTPRWPSPLLVCSGCSGPGYDVMPRVAPSVLQYAGRLQCAQVTWEDARGSSHPSVYLACVSENVAGSPLVSSPSGLTSATGFPEEFPSVILSSTNAAIAGWQENGSGPVRVFGETSPLRCLDVAPVGVTWTGVTPGRPNPFVARVHFSVTLVARGPVALDVFDPQGRRIRTLARRTFEAGTQAFDWDGVTDSGAQAPAGVYVLRARLDGGEWHQTFVRLR